MRSFLAKFVFVIALLTSYEISFALSPELRLDEKDEKRAQNLFLEVRCVVCGGQVIENSDSAFSQEMRQLIRKKILAKKSNAEIKKELVEEFGEDILVNHSITNPVNLPLSLIVITFITLTSVLFIRNFLKNS